MSIRWKEPFKLSSGGYSPDEPLPRWQMTSTPGSISFQKQSALTSTLVHGLDLCGELIRDVTGQTVLKDRNDSRGDSIAGLTITRTQPVGPPSIPHARNSSH